MYCNTCKLLISDEQHNYDSIRNHLDHDISFGDSKQP